MKHLVAILAHKNPTHLKRLISTLVDFDMNVLVHLDLKTRIGMEQDLGAHKSFVIEKSIDVRRGHISIVEASLALMLVSTQHEFDYFHLISGDDFVVKSKDEIDAFFKMHHDKQFVNCNKLPINPTVVSNAPTTANKDRINTANYCFPFFKNGIGLVDTYHFPESSFVGRGIQYLTRYPTFVKAYHTVFKRKIPQVDFYAGSAWFSLTKRAVDYIAHYSKSSPHLLHFMKHSLFPDEIYFHTVMMNSEFANSVVNSDLRYITWESQDNFGPDHLGLEVLENIKKSNAVFSRKWDVSDTEMYEAMVDKLLK